MIKKIETANEAELLHLVTVINSFDKEPRNWFYDLPRPIQELLKESMKHIDEGKTFPNEEVMRETRAKYGLRKIDLANPPQEIKDLLKIAIKQGENGQTRSNDEIKKLINNKYGFQL